jgi:hypothetical protein
VAEKPADNEFLVFRCPGCAPRYVGVHELAQQATQELGVGLHRLTKLPLRLRTLEGEPIEDAYLRVEAVPFLPEYRSQIARPLIDGLDWNGPTDAKGAFELSDLPCDEALIVTPLSRFIGKSATFVLTEGAAEATRELVAIAPGGITGRVVGVDGKPLAGARIDCTPRRPWSSNGATAMTDDEGNFSLNAAPTGPQSLNCTPGYQGGYAMLSAHPFEVNVEPFSRTDVGELVFGDTSVCSGRIVGLPRELEKELNRTRFELTQDGTRYYPSDFQSDGSFRFGAPAGPAKVQIILALDWDSGRPILARSVTLPCEGVELDVTPMLATLRFRLEPGSDVELASATLYDPELDEKDGTPAWQGALSRFDFDREGDLFVIKTLLPGRFRLELQARGGAMSWLGEVQLEAGKTRDLGTLTLGTAGLSGSLAGAPPGSVVDLERRTPGMFGKGAFGDEHFDHRTATVAADGTFRFDKLPAGMWCATANCKDVALLDPTLIRLDVADAKTIALRASRASSVRCRVRRGSVPVIGAEVSCSFARSQSLRPFFELNPDSKRLPSGSDGSIELKTLYPGPYRIDIEIGDERICRYIDLKWGEQRELDFDFDAPEFTLELDAPESLLAHLFRLEYRTLDEDGPNAGLRASATRTGLHSFTLRAPPSKGYVALAFERGQQGGAFPIPLTLREDRRKLELAMPRGEIAVRVGSESEHWFPPNVQVVELPGAKLLAYDSRFSTLPMEKLADGSWLARGITEGSLVRIEPGDQRERFGPPAQFIRFDSGRLELTWP